MNLEELRARLAEILASLEADALAALTDEELTAASDALLDCFSAAREISGPEGLAEATACRDAIVSVRTERARRAEEAATTAAAFDALADELIVPEPDPEPEVVAEADAEPEVVEDPEPPVEVVDEPVEGGDGGEPAAVPELVPAGTSVAAPGTGPAPARQSAGQIGRIAAARRPTVPATAKAKPITAKVKLSDDGSAVLKNRTDICEAFGRSHERWAQASPGMSMNIPVVRVEWEYPEARSLKDIGSSPDAVSSRLDAAFVPQALTAAGGICAPFPIDYSLLNISSDERPVMDALPKFQAARGGIQFMPSYTLADISTGATNAAINQYTLANDVAAATKQCQAFTCKSVQTANVYAITRCVTFGNWNARFYPELIDNIMLQVQAVQARFAEQLLLQAMGAGSTQVDFNGVSWAGATASLLAAVGRAVQRLRHSARAAVAPIRVAFPNWVRDMVREDMSLRLAHEIDQFSIIDAWFDTQVRTRGGIPWYFIDGENDIQGMYAVQPQGPLLDWPNEVVFYVYFEGAWIMLDGGTLDLGLVRDSTLNLANNFQMFAETWEGIFSRGLPSLRVNATVCANGASAGTYATEPCAS